MTITFIGHGYVGLVTACVFANLGNTVYVIGRNKEKIKKLQNGQPLIFEPGLSELLKKNLAQKRIFFTTSYKNTIPLSQVVFIAVGTPPKNNGESDLSSVFTVAKKIGENLKQNYTVVVCKSTVPVGTNQKIHQIIKKNKPKNCQFDIVSCPEFLREGTAIYDTLFPDRIVIGANSKKAINLLTEVHKPLEGKRLIVRLESAETIKYASNSILATKISFANLISFLCEKTDADVAEVLDGVGLDQRIGRTFLYPGIGYGGSCFPKDVKALIKIGESLNVNMNLLSAVDQINQQARENVLNKVLKYAPAKNIGIWGLSFKPNTDDIREAPSIFIIEQLLKREFKIKVYDPEAMENVKKIFNNQIQFCSNPQEAIKNVSLLVILTEWDEFKQINLSKVKKLMTHKTIVDGRNIYNPQLMRQLDFTYLSVGRKK
jgi:UDPglucose 6-dehydrogenase